MDPELPTVGELIDWLSGFDRSDRVRGFSEHAEDEHSDGVLVFNEGMEKRGFFRT